MNKRANQVHSYQLVNPGGGGGDGNAGSAQHPHTKKEIITTISKQLLKITVQHKPKEGEKEIISRIIKRARPRILNSEEHKTDQI